MANKITSHPKIKEFMETGRCGVRPPKGKQCSDECRCFLTPKHKTPHRAFCGLSWANKKSKKGKKVSNDYKRVS